MLPSLFKLPPFLFKAKESDAPVVPDKGVRRRKMAALIKKKSRGKRTC